MDKSKYYKFLSEDISCLKGVGKKIKYLLKKKKNRKSFRLAMEFTTILCRQIQLKKLRCFGNR